MLGAVLTARPSETSRAVVVGIKHGRARRRWASAVAGAAFVTAPPSVASLSCRDVQ